MLTVRYIVILLLLLACGNLHSQTFERTFMGWWASTSWKFEFKRDGSMTLTTRGHFAFNSWTSPYTMKEDSIFVVSSKEAPNPAAGVYLLWKDSCLIDLSTFYEYLEHVGDTLFTSKKRYDILSKPDPYTKIYVTQQQFDSLVVELTSLLLKSEYVTQISDEKHIQIVRIYNTISQERLLRESGICVKYLETIESKDYIRKMGDAYDWQPSWGMGMYFQKLQIQSGGGPVSQSRYFIQ